jgi:AAA+ superfamily predicted ATPase
MITAVDAPYQNGTEHLLAALAVVDLRMRWGVARAHAAGLDPDDEFRGLYISDGQIDALLGYEFGHHLWAGGSIRAEPHAHPANGQVYLDHGWPEAVAKARGQWQVRTRASQAAGFSLPLDRLTHAFALTPTEVDVLLIALAPELDPRYERFFAYLQDDVTRKLPSVDLILNLLTSSFQEKLRLRALLTNDGRLIHSRLLRRYSDNSRRTPLLAQYVRPSANVVEHLLGRPALDDALSTSVEWRPVDLPAPRAHLPAALREQLAQVSLDHAARRPLFILVGATGAGRGEVAHQLAADAGQPLLTVNLVALTAGEMGIGEGLRLVERDGRLLDAILYLTHWEAALSDGQPPSELAAMLLNYPNTIVIAAATPWQPGHRFRARPVFAFDLEAPDYEERRRLWAIHLDETNGLNLDHVASHFRLTPGQIADAAATAHDLARRQSRSLVTNDLLAAGRIHSNHNLAALATKIEPRYTWDDIVLPPDTRRQLQEMVNTVRHRPLVYDRWGFSRKIALGRGMNALFAGESGTGKTMSADIIAGALGLDLYRVDLSTLVSKYVGETEKNLDHIFREAATSNAVLFFDEADAIFGKRSEVKDSHDRYANIEISYLLQRMEAYDGVVILATNMRANLDEAFTRRLHFAIEFPFPEAVDREHIWRVTVPEELPLAADVDFALLAQRFRIAGGNIRNIILAAAFLAAENDEPLGLTHLLHAARREYQKMGRLIDERLFRITK